ncbi:MAG: TetR/AcrR family transcriptional regulator C-terminal domain-containing protein [Acidimicrobiia bacterium]|nr:TetR/AcrR family transcriptional regulator C-terminal domain-containing protein [Acidimicrobiia bacterium]
MRLVNERGASALTMRALATELDIEAPSLYKHIANKDEILDGLCELVYSQVTVGEVSDDWHERLKAYAGAYRRALLQNRNVAPILAVRPVATEGSMALVEASLSEFVRAGVDPETGRRLLNIIGSFVVGHVLAEVADPAPGVAEQDRLAEIRATLNPAMYPLTLATLGTSVADRDAEFKLALDLLIDAITIRYAEELAQARSVAT